MGGTKVVAEGALTMADAVTSLMGVVSTVMTTITGNAVLMTFFLSLIHI